MFVNKNFLNLKENYLFTEVVRGQKFIKKKMLGKR